MLNKDKDTEIKIAVTCLYFYFSENFMCIMFFCGSKVMSN